MSSPPDPLAFVVGCGRSGSTLLRAMLDSHPAVAVPPETHVVPLLLRQAAGSQPLDRAEFAALASRTGFLSKWRLDEQNLRSLLEEKGSATPGDAIREMYAHYASAHGKAFAAEKTPNYIRDLGQLAATFPRSRFIHLVRDPRDVAASFRVVGFESTVGVTALRWARIVDRWDRRAQVVATDRCLEVRYEDLTTDAEGSLKRICDHLCLDFDPAMLSFHERSAEVLVGVDDPSIHQRLGQPVQLTVNWPDALSATEVAAVERLVGARLTTRGYRARGFGRTQGAGHVVRAHLERVIKQSSQRARRFRNGVVARP